MNFILSSLTAFWTVYSLVLACGTDTKGFNQDARLLSVGASSAQSSEESETHSEEATALAAKEYSIKILQNTIFKTSTKDSSQLPANEKCDLLQGTHLLLEQKPRVVNFHWKVAIKGKPKGCAFSEGYLHEAFAIVPQLARPGYTVPIPGASVTSRWCRCRDIGTSPHIGLDLAKDGGMRSYALANAYVQSVVFNGACGWEVTLRDEGGATWLYRHLNQPNLARGSRLALGDFVGIHASYPEASCGSGPHLHLERLTAGSFKDSSVGKTCQYGYSSCNYNPGKAFTELNMVTEFEALPAAAHEVAPQPADNALSNCSPYQANPVDTKWTRTELAEQFSSSATQADLKTELVIEAQKVLRHGSHELPLLQFQLSVRNGARINALNRCDGQGDGIPCIEKWELFAEAKSGSMQRIVSDQSSQNTPIQIRNESLFCLSEEFTQHFVVVATLNDGQTIFRPGTFRPSFRP